MGGWYLDIVVGYIIRIVALKIKTRGCDRWPMQRAQVADSKVDRSVYGGKVAEVVYTWTREGSFFSGLHREPFILPSSAEEYAARFCTGADVIVRVKPEHPEVSLIRNADQTSGMNLN